MKKYFSKTFAVILTICLIFGFVPITGYTVSETDAVYKTGDVIEFGSYPQSRVDDSTIIKELDAEAENIDWISYGYYYGSGSWDDNSSTASDYMQYKDIAYGGEKYRAVRFTKYRPEFTWDTPTEDHSRQGKNFYHLDWTYYFKYEPLSWKILDPDEGYVMCENIIDSQAYQNTVCYSYGNSYNNKEHTNYASDWATSSLRHWLNEDFYNTAFTQEEKSQIGSTSYLENVGSGLYADSYPYTYDKIFIISYADAKNSEYGFIDNSDAADPARTLSGTDYARCQGLSKQNSEYSPWWIRVNSSFQSEVAFSSGGMFGFDGDAEVTSRGVVPAFKFNPPAFKINISFDLKGGEWAVGYSAPTSYMSNEAIDFPSSGNVKKNGFTFNGWEQSLVENNTAFYKAKWIVKGGYTVSFNSGEVSAISDKSDVKWTDKVLDGVNNPEKDGYTFVCWKYGNTNANPNTTYGNLAKDDTLMKITLDAEYIPNTYTATLMVDGKVYKEIPYTYGSEKIALPKVPQKEGFIGEWENYSLGVGGVVINAIYTALPKNVKSVSVDDMSLIWKKTGQLAPKINADDGVVYTVSYSTSDPKIATVDKNGKVTAVDKGTATVTCTVTDSNGNTVTDICKVTVTYTWWQWIIKFVLFGWIWY